jgi:hypothetical protein
VTIIGRGDLMPRRRRRHYGRYVTVALVVILLGGGGYAAYRGLKNTHSTSPGATLALCKKGAPRAAGSPPPASAKTGKTTIVVDNATLVSGLAAQVAGELRTRGFTIASVGNTAARGRGVATVRYSPDRKVVGEQLAAQIKGATLVEAAGSKRVELDVGPKYTALRSTRAAGAALRKLVAADAASASPSPSATPTPTCRPRPVKSKRG